MKATIGNMQKAKHFGHLNVFAYSPDTGEEYSADPGDYFLLSNDVCLRDDNGTEMILVKKKTVMEEFDLN